MQTGITGMGRVNRPVTQPIPGATMQKGYNFDTDADLAPKGPIPVTYGGEDYLLHEAPEEAVIAYRCTMSKGTTMEDQTINLSDGIPAADAVLVAHCLFSVKTPDKHVEVDLIRSWPHRVVKPLYDAAKEISGINDEQTVEAIDKEITKLNKRREKAVKREATLKNSQPATGVTSS